MLELSYSLIIFSMPLWLIRYVEFRFLTYFPPFCNLISVLFKFTFLWYFFLEFTKTSTTIGLGSAEKINFLHFFKIFKIADALANYSSCFFLLSFIFFFLPISKCLSILMSQDGSHWPSLAHWFSLTHSAKLKLAKSGSNQLKVLIIIYRTIDLGANSLLGANKIAYHFEWSP